MRTNSRRDSLRMRCGARPESGHLNPVKKAKEHRVSVVTVAVTPDVFVEVTLKPLLGNVSMRTNDTVFNYRPETFDSVRVNVSEHVYARGVIDLPVVEHFMFHRPVSRKGIGVDDRTLSDVLADSSDQTRRRNVWHGVSAGAATAFHHAENGNLLVSRPTASAVRPLGDRFASVGVGRIPDAALP